MIKVFYWCPYISDVATVNAVFNSAKSLEKYSNKKIQPTIINAVGEWDKKKEDLKDSRINILNFFSKNYFEKLPKLGFFKSRITYIIIFFLTIRKLHKTINLEKPDYIILHLITFIPLILLNFFNYETKFILRISGFPKLNFFRSFVWKSVKNKIFYVTCPTNLTLELLIKKKIFLKEKISYLPDPILDVKFIQKKKIERINNNKFDPNNTILSIGRLTKQKNFDFLIRNFKKISENYPMLNLCILGDGEQRNQLMDRIVKLKLEKKIFLLGYKKNVFKYLKKCKAFVITSSYEDPGFVLIEAGYMNKTIISSDCPNGPREIIENNKNGYLFKSNSDNDFNKVFNFVMNETKSSITKKKINMKKKCKEFTIFSHYQLINRILK